MMVRTEMYLLLGLLLIADRCFSSAAEQCQGCNIDENCCRLQFDNASCSNLRVQVNGSSTIEEGDSVTLTCSHNIPDLSLTYTWFKDGNEYTEGTNKTTLFLEKILSSQKGDYKCCVNSSCGECASEAFTVTYNNNGLIIILVCGVGALALITIMGVAMKLKLKKDTAKHKERMRQRVEAAQSAASTSVTLRGL